MGFPVKLYLVFPESQQVEVEPEFDDEEDLEPPQPELVGYEVYVKRDLIDFDRVTRLEKLTGPQFQHLTWDAHHRAAICVVSCWLRQLLAEMAKENLRIVAPHVLGYQEHHERQTDLSRRPCGWPQMDLGPYENPTMQHMITSHNVLREGVVASGGQLSACDPISDGPILWVSAATLADWLDEAERTSADEWNELLKDPVSLARAKAWRASL